jgi:hypothetical protein
LEEYINDDGTMKRALKTDTRAFSKLCHKLPTSGSDIHQSIIDLILFKKLYHTIVKKAKKLKIVIFDLILLMES